jgi:hypothetical protein
MILEARDSDELARDWKNNIRRILTFGQWRSGDGEEQTYHGKRGIGIAISVLLGLHQIRFESACAAWNVY